MGEAKFLTTLSETSSGKRRLHFETGLSRESSLKRHSTLGEGSISLGAVDGAPSTCCAKHSSVNFLILFERPIPCAKNRLTTLRSSPEGSRGLPEAFLDFFEKNIKF